MELELRADHDDRTARVVDALAEQVLAEAALLALQHVGERFERTLAAAADRLAATTIVEQRVDRLLQHALLIAQDDVRRAHLHQLLQPVVPVDDATVQVVQVRRRETAAVERNERTQIRRDHRDHVHDHPLGLVARLRRCAAVADRVDDLQPLQLLLLAVLRRLVRDLVAQAVRPPVDTAPGLVALLERLVRRVRHAQQRAHRLGTDLRLERAVALFAGLDAQLVVLVLVEQLLELERLLRILRIHLLAGVRNDVRRVVDDLLQVTQRHAEQVAHLARQRLEEPDVRDRHGQLDVPHALAAHLRQRDLDAALVADVAADTNALELPAVAFPVLDRTEDALAEEPVTLRLERPVVDGLRLRHLAVAPAPDLLRGSDLQLDEVEVARPRLAGARKIDHLNISPAYAEWSPLHCQTAGPGPRAPGRGRGSCSRPFVSVV